MAQTANSLFPPCHRQQWLAGKGCRRDAGPQVPKHGSRLVLVPYERSILFVYFKRSIVLVRVGRRLGLIRCYHHVTVDSSLQVKFAALMRDCKGRSADRI